MSRQEIVFITNTHTHTRTHYTNIGAPKLSKTNIAGLMVFKSEHGGVLRDYGLGIYVFEGGREGERERDEGCMEGSGRTGGEKSATRRRRYTCV
jgi:hypothetical protein